MTGDILATIDHVIDDWETSQDAMRWLPEVPPEPESAHVVIYDEPHDLAWVALHAALVEAMRPLVERIVAEMDRVARAVNESFSSSFSLRPFGILRSQIPDWTWTVQRTPILVEVAIRDAVEHFGDVAWQVRHEGWLPGPVSLADHFGGIVQAPAARGERSPGPVSQTYDRRGRRRR